MLHTLRKDNKTMRGLLLGAVAVLAVMMLSIDSRAAAQDGAHQAKVPQTAQDHYALADHYKKEATELRGEIQKHNDMLAEYSKGVATNTAVSARLKHFILPTASMVLSRLPAAGHRTRA